MRQCIHGILAALLGAAVLLAGAGRANANPVGYQFDVTTNYAFSLPGGTFTDMGGPSPDTGYWTVTNNGASTFSGTIGQVAVSTFNGDNSYSHSLTLAPGQTVSFAVNAESSNMGGYNGAFNSSPQPGVEIFLNGTVALGANSEGVSLSVHDADIHSGVPRTNPFGVTVDSYVLQGGDPFGRDTGDAFETTQASGHFRFFQGSGGAAAPEPSSIVLLGLGAVGMMGYRWRQRRQGIVRE